MDWFHGAVGAYCTLRMLSVIEVVLAAFDEFDEFDEFRAAFGSVPVPPKKDWYQPRSVLAPIDPTTFIPLSVRA